MMSFGDRGGALKSLPPVRRVIEYTPVGRGLMCETSETIAHCSVILMNSGKDGIASNGASQT